MSSGTLSTSCNTGSLKAMQRSILIDLNPHTLEDNQAQEIQQAKITIHL